MSDCICPLTPVSKTRFRTAQGDEFDVFDPETDDAEMKRVRDQLLLYANGYHALAWAVNCQAKVVQTVAGIWELYLPGRGLPTSVGTSRDEAISKAMNIVAGGER